MKWTDFNLSFYIAQNPVSLLWKHLFSDALSMVPAWYFVYLNISQPNQLLFTTQHLPTLTFMKTLHKSLKAGVFWNPEKRNRWNPTRPCEEMYSLYSTCCSLLNVEFLPVSIWAISTTGRRHRPRRIFFSQDIHVVHDWDCEFFWEEVRKNRGAWGMWFCKFQHVEPSECGETNASIL